MSLKNREGAVSEGDVVGFGDFKGRVRRGRADAEEHEGHKFGRVHGGCGEGKLARGGCR